MSDLELSIEEQRCIKRAIEFDIEYAKRILEMAEEDGGLPGVASAQKHRIDVMTKVRNKFRERF